MTHKIETTNGKLILELVKEGTLDPMDVLEEMVSRYCNDAAGDILDIALLKELAK
jgi:hypothetical protein